MTKLTRLSEFREQARHRPPTVRLPFLNEVELSPFREGRSYLVSAYSKVGKTEIFIRTCQLWGEEEWGSREVLWVSEESQMIWEDRSLILPKLPDNISIGNAMGMPLKDIGAMVNDTPWDVLVIDTVKMLRIQDENDTAEVMSKLTPLLAKQQEENKIAIFLHHTRKAGGSHGMSASGSHAFSAAVDAVLEISRYKKKNQRLLSGEGRIEPVASLVYELDEETGLFLVTGQLEDYQKSNVGDRMLAVMTKEWMTTKKVSALLDPEPSDAGKALRMLARDGKVERDPPMVDGQRAQGKTYRWRKA